MSELARRACVAKSHVSKTVDLLSERGFLKKWPDPEDRRLQRVYLTPAAEEQLARLRARIRGRLAELVAAIPAEQVQEAIAGLRALRDGLHAARARGRNA